MSSYTQNPTPGQIPQNLPGPTAYLTTHDEKSGKAIIHSSRPVAWHRYDEDKLGMGVAYTTQFPPDLNEHADVTEHDRKMQESGGKLGLVSGGGTVLRYVDFAPEYVNQGYNPISRSRFRLRTGLSAARGRAERTLKLDHEPV
jgi:hypothetical protein